MKSQDCNFQEAILSFIERNNKKPELKKFEESMVNEFLVSSLNRIAENWQMLPMSIQNRRQRPHYAPNDGG